MDFTKLLNNPILSGLKDWVNVEIKNPSSLIDEVQKRFMTKINPLASDEEKANLNNKIDLTQYFQVNITDRTKKILIWGGIGLLLFIFLRRLK